MTSLNTHSATMTETSQPLFRRSPRTHSLTGVRILGCGGYVPEREVTNAELEARSGLEPGWIEQRSGIICRRYAAPEQATSDLGALAAEKVLQNCGVAREDVDLLVVGTFTPDYHCPSTACLIQDKLNLDVPAFDVGAACAGFMYALITAAQYVATGNSEMALVIGADVNTRIVDPNQEKIAPLFGDGAGAVLLTRGHSNQGLLCYQLGADGKGGPLLERPAGGTARPTTIADLEQGRQYLQMDGRTVFKWAIEAVTETIQLVLSRTGLKAEDVDLFALHQANIRIIHHAMKVLGVPPEKVLNNLDAYGNTSGASIPLVLDQAMQEKRLRPGSNVLMCGFGGGLTWGTGLFRW